MLIRNLVYILQSEQYCFLRFLKFVYSHFDWWHFEKRQKITWTVKARLIWTLTWVEILAALFFAYWGFGRPGLMVVFVVIPVLPFFVGVANMMVLPLDALVRACIIRKAKKMLLKEALTVVGITGSYGKTSTKEILATILAQQFKVVKTPENINTDLGVAQFILKNATQLKSAEIFIVEMGAYKIGDIRKLCNLVRPKISILTGINESHLERFGSLENTIQTKFELPVNTTNVAVLNLDDKNVKERYKRFTTKRMALSSKESVSKIRLLEEFKGLEFEYEKTTLKTKLLAQHNISLILLCAAVAKELGMEMPAIAVGVEKVPHVSHRLEPIKNQQTNIWVIDDSYNGNINGIISGLEVLKRAPARKIVLTPGLVELGVKEQEIHERIGKLYVQEKIDFVLLIKNQATKYIAKVLKQSGYGNYKEYETTAAAHADLPNILKAGDTIIFQNDWTDNYF